MSIGLTTHRHIERKGDVVELRWKDPLDTIVDDFVLVSWDKTIIVKKEEEYPETPEDGILVVESNERNKYWKTPYKDVQEDSGKWFYRAFPVATSGAICYDARNCFGPIVYGYRINELDPDPNTKVEYLGGVENTFYEPCRMIFDQDTFYWGSWKDAFFIPRPCALNRDGTVEYYLDPDNFNLKEDGLPATLNDTLWEGNFMVEFPPIFMKSWVEDHYLYVLFSNEKLDDGFECWSCKKEDGTYAAHFYLPMFEGTNVNSVLRSLGTNAKPTGGSGGVNELLWAETNGVYKDRGEGWSTTWYCDEVLMQFLFPLLFRHTNSQARLGMGTSALVNNDGCLTKGMMYGTAAASSAGTVYLGMHNWFACRWKRIQGLILHSSAVLVKMTPSKVDGSLCDYFSSDDVANVTQYINTGTMLPNFSNAYVSRFQPIGENGKYGILPYGFTGSSTTYYTDLCWTTKADKYCGLYGGGYVQGVGGGIFGIACCALRTATNADYGASLSYHLNWHIEKPADPEGPPSDPS